MSPSEARNRIAALLANARRREDVESRVLQEIDETPLSLTEREWLREILDRAAPDLANLSPAEAEAVLDLIDKSKREPCQ